MRAGLVYPLSFYVFGSKGILYTRLFLRDFIAITIPVYYNVTRCKMSLTSLKRADVRKFSAFENFLRMRYT